MAAREGETEIQSHNSESKNMVEQMKKMAKCPAELEKDKARYRGLNKDPLGEMNAPLSRAVWHAALPPKVKMPEKVYSGVEDPLSLLESFVQHMEVQNATRKAMCRMFPCTHNDFAKTCLRKLPLGSVNSFTKLLRDFIAQFQGVKPPPKDPILL